MGNELQENNIRQIEAWTPKEVMSQVQAIQELMRQGMKEDEHFGIVPGTNSKKPSLLKAGAEKLCLMFRLAPRFEITEKDLGNGHKNVQVICTLTHINTSAFWGQGVASCSTMESKYRYRSGAGASTGIQVPKDFWNLRRAGKSQEAMEMIGGKGYTTMKGEDGLWYIAEKIEKVENPDIADVYNTVLKIAKKRALVDATLTATAASDIFTQDLEELQAEAKTEVKKAEVVDKIPDSLEPCITREEQQELIILAGNKNVDLNELRGYLKKVLKVDGSAKIKKNDYSKVYEWILKNEHDGIEL